MSGQASMLLPGERLVAERPVDLRLPDHLEEPHVVLARLCGVNLPEEIGAAGPPMAAAAPIGNELPELDLFDALFGRDSLVVADLVGERYPVLAQATIRRLAELQATRHDRASEAEPGRITHEVRLPDDPLSARMTEEKGWAWPFYGSVDATPLFVLVAGQVEARSPGFLAETYRDADGDTRPLVDAVARAVTWVLRRLRSPSGLIESVRTHPGSHLNQVWKDSYDSYHHADGTLATPDTVASVEVAAHAYDALWEAARLTIAYPQALWPAPAKELTATARGLRRRLVDVCWVEGGRFFAIGVDRDQEARLRPLAIRTSNMGRLLDSGILDGEEWRSYREAVVHHLFSQEMLAPAGIRTLAAGAARYRPGSYHNGSVWPFDTRLIARGLARHGYTDLAVELNRRLVAACQAVRCYPEFVRGDGLDINRHVVEVEDAEGRTNRVEQPPQLFQAWTVAAYISATTP